MPHTSTGESSTEKLSTADEIIEISQKRSPEAAYTFIKETEDQNAVEKASHITAGEVTAESDGILLFEKAETKKERVEVTSDTIETLGQLFVVANELKGNKKADLFATVVPERCYDTLFGKPTALEVAKAGGREKLVAQRFGFEVPSQPGGNITSTEMAPGAKRANADFAEGTDAYSQMVSAIHERSTDDLDAVTTERYHQVASVCKEVALFALEDIQEITRSGKPLSPEDMGRLQQMTELVNQLVQQGLVHERMAYIVEETKKDKANLFVPRDKEKDAQHPFFHTNNARWEG